MWDDRWPSEPPDAVREVDELVVPRIYRGALFRSWMRLGVVGLVSVTVPTLVNLGYSVPGLAVLAVAVAAILAQPVAMTGAYLRIRRFDLRVGRLQLHARDLVECRVEDQRALLWLHTTDGWLGLWCKGRTSGEIRWIRREILAMRDRWLRMPVDAVPEAVTDVVASARQSSSHREPPRIAE